MTDPSGANTELIQELASLRQRIAELEQSESDRKQAEEALRDSEKKYRELSIVDDLTQLYNSRHFYFQLQFELDRSNRYEQPFTLLLLDLDDFKAFNDAYGHVEGDRVLWRLGHVVKRCLRQTDSAYRYGGDEFTIILPMTTSGEGVVTAERIRTEFQKEAFSPAPGQEVRVMVSIGLAQYKQKEDMKAFVNRVDQLMYQGKKNGKDRVWFQPSPFITKRECQTNEQAITNQELNEEISILRQKNLELEQSESERKRSEEALRISLGQVRRVMQTMVQVLGLAVGTSDPYTAGHQKRTTDLTWALATEMGLSPEQIKGIRMAGMIHDIGKISIPREILSKTTKLSAVEFSLIKEHARQGYEILKGVESPWALAEMVYQHHERINGSGYPRGLKGDEIIIEARILAVADVVESMASCRPYRAALGIEVALDEIGENRGVLYDPSVVDACLRLFKENGYRLPEAYQC
jgi:diguanylate cyclase (GGDEF)-like protein